MTWSALLTDAATRRAWHAAWQAREKPDLQQRVAELVGAAERATEAEFIRRLELAAADGFDLRNLLDPDAIIFDREALARLTLDELADLMRTPPSIAYREAA